MAEASQNDACNGKPRQTVKSAKISLGNPFQTFKPLLNETQVRKIAGLMKSLLHRERSKTKLPWKKLCKLPKEVRKERINELNEKNVVSEEVKKQRKSIKFGLNAVARALQHCHVSSCLLAGDVEPEILIEHLITLAVTRGIPVLIVPELKKITYQTVGFPCVALGIMAKEEHHYLKPLDQEISCLFSDFKRPSNYACILKKKNAPPVTRKKLQITEKVKLEQQQSTNSETAAGSKELPESSKNRGTPMETLDFISLNTESTSSKTDNLPRGINIDSIYLTPNFKRVKQNLNKIKKKKKK